MELNQSAVSKLCWLINNHLKAQLVYSRAQWRTSYYRKYENSSKTSEKWEDHTDIAKKIESCRLFALKKQEELLKLNKLQQKEMMQLIKSLKVIVQREQSKIVGFSIPLEPSSKRTSNTWKEYNLDQIADLADQYEADKILTKELSQGNE